MVLTRDPRSSELGFGSEEGCEFYFDVLPPTSDPSIGAYAQRGHRVVDRVRRLEIDLQARSIAAGVSLFITCRCSSVS